MAYHDSVWLIAGAAAPVIGLAHALLVGRYRPRIRELIAAIGGLTPLLERISTETRQRLETIGNDIQASELVLREMKTRFEALEQGPADGEGEAEFAQLRIDLETHSETVRRLKRRNESSLALNLRRRKIIRSTSRSMILGYLGDWVAAVSWLMCTAVLGLSLLSASAERDLCSIWVVAGLLLVPMAVAGLLPLVEVRLSRLIENPLPGIGDEPELAQ